MSNPTSQPAVQQPIFVLGTGRCGSTVFFEVFSYHPRVAYLTRLADRYPRDPRYNRAVLRLLETPLLGPWLRKRYPPSEAWTFWTRQIPGFARPYRDLRRSDVLPAQARRARRSLAEHLTPRRSRLLVKLTGWSRIGFLLELFPDARFVHVVRDGRAVVNSLLNVGFWRGWRGPDQWRWGSLDESERREWLAADESFVVLAAIQYRKVMASYDAALRGLAADRYLEVRYEDFAAEPVSCFERVLSFCGLDHDRDFGHVVKDFPLRDTNYKWQEQLTRPQQQELNRTLEQVLARHGYEGSR